MKKGVVSLVVGAVLMITGMFIVPALFILPYILGDSSSQQFTVPGSVQFPAGEAGRYYLWNDHQVVFEGRNFNKSIALPDGVVISVTDGHGNVLPFTGDTSISSTIGGASKQSIGYIDLEEPPGSHLSPAG